MADQKKTNHPEVTETVLNGGGLFDELMRSMKAHLLEEYTQQRIRGAEYSKVYLGSLQAVLGGSVQYLLGSQFRDQQRALLESQKNLVDAQVWQINELTPLEREKLELQKDMLALEKERLRFQIDELLPLEKKKLRLQNRQLAAQIPLIEAQVKVAEAQIILTRAQASKVMQELKMIPYQIDLMKWQSKTAEAQYGLTKLQRSLIGQQIHKTRQERFLVEARYATEQTNWSNGVFTDHFYDFAHEMVYEQELVPPDPNDPNAPPTYRDKLDAGGNKIPLRDKRGNIIYKRDEFGRRIRKKDANGNDVPIPWEPKGMVRRQKDLLYEQQMGFVRDTEQKTAKIISDTFAIMRSTDENLSPPSGLNADNANSVLRNMVQNSGTEFFMYDNELVSLLNAVPVPEYYGVKVNKNPVDNPDNDTATKDPNLPWDPDKIPVGGGGGGGYDNIVRPADKSLKSKS